MDTNLNDSLPLVKQTELTGCGNPHHQCWLTRMRRTVQCSCALGGKGVKDEGRERLLGFARED